MLKAVVFLPLLGALLAGCSTYSSNLQVGNEQIYSSIADQRNAAKMVTIHKELPEGATVLSTVSAGRCHRSLVEQAPEEATVLIDLKVAAYAQGADGISNVAITKDSGLNKNCWYILGGTAKAFSLSAKPASGS